MLLQGLPLLLGCGMAVVEVEEEEDDESDGGEISPEVAAEMLVEVTADGGTCSLVTQGCEVIPSEESAARHSHFKPELLKHLYTIKYCEF